LAEAVALREKLYRFERAFIGVVVNLKKDHLKRISQRLKASLDDGRSGTVAGEREKLAHLGRVRAVVDRLAHLCREEAFGRRINLFFIFVHIN
jgi:hypothetical protein